MERPGRDVDEAAVDLRRPRVDPRHQEGGEETEKPTVVFDLRGAASAGGEAADCGGGRRRSREELLA